MKKRSVFLSFVVPYLLFACTAPVTSTPLVIESPSASPEPTFTALPTVTHTATAMATDTPTPRPQPPTVTPATPLGTEGLYLAYFQEVKGIRRLVFMAADGRTRRVMDLPESINSSFAPVKPFDLDVGLVSPDGHWLAFYTGSAGSYGQMPAPGTSDLTLHLLDLLTGEEQVLAPLLSKEYPENFVEAAAQLNDPDITAQFLYDAFVSGITESFAWSPDGQYLAFAGQMDGLSSDLYVYDVKEKNIRRLSSGPQELQWIEWSPDGKRILHSSVFAVGVGMTFDIYAAALDSASVPYLSTNIKHDGIESWLNSHQYFENDGENVIGTYGLRLVDIDTGKITSIWDETFYSYVVDRSGRWVAILDSPDVSSSESGFNFESNFIPGMYLIDLETLEQSRVEFPDVTHEYGDVKAFGLGGQDFVMMDRTSRNPVFISTEGRITQADLGDVKIFVSPNAEYWIAITEQEVKIFSADNTLMMSSDLPDAKMFVEGVIWRLDSSGLFLVSGADILSMNIPAGDIEAVESSLMNDNYNRAYRWIDEP